MTKLNLNDALRQSEFKDHPQFGQVAAWAAGQSFTSIEDMLAGVRLQFTAPAERQGMRTKHQPYTNFCEERVESAALDQFHTALSIPPAIQGALMPDAHPGYSMPIGGVVALENAISPSFVGLDIGCRMHMTIIDIDSQFLNGPISRASLLHYLQQSTSFGVGSETKDIDHSVMYADAWNEPFLKTLKPLAQEQLGSSGGGNHFADIMQGEIVYYPNESIKWLPHHFVALVTHSGSRGTGKKVADHYVQLADQAVADKYIVPKGYGWLDMDTDLGKEYWNAMQLMGNYARANHQIIHQRFMDNIMHSAIATFSNHHNFCWHEDGHYVHRKGATPAHLGEMGIIPGSSGTNSYLVIGKGNASSLNSASHGAGRVSSRSKAKEVFDKELFDIQMEGITYAGVNPDEGFQAYKNIESVMAAQRELVDIVAVMHPKVVLMCGSSKTDDGD
jgi:tRNA-splicing ligase RtcB